MSVTFDAISGHFYGFGGEGYARVDTFASVVPIPAAAWLYASGIMGAGLCARRKKSLS